MLEGNNPASLQDEEKRFGITLIISFFEALATSVIEILDYEIDFLNLRGEEYTEDSRIPI